MIGIRKKLKGYYQKVEIRKLLENSDLLLGKELSTLLSQSDAVLEDFGDALIPCDIILKGYKGRLRSIEKDCTSDIKEYQKYLEELIKNAEKYKRNSRMDKIIKDPLMLSSNQRASAIGEIIAKKGFDNFIDDFKREVINIRNQFAHAVLDIDKNGREFFRNKSEGITFDDELCKKIRIDINKHKENLDRLVEYLKS